MQLHDWTLVQYYAVLFTLGYFEFDSLKTVLLNYGILFLIVLTVRKNKKEIVQALSEGLGSLFLNVISHPLIAFSVNFCKQLQVQKKTVSEATVVKGRWLKVDFLQNGEIVTLVLPYKRTLIRQEKIEIMKDGEVIEKWTKPLGIELQFTAEEYRCDEIRVTK